VRRWNIWAPFAFYASFVDEVSNPWPIEMVKPSSFSFGKYKVYYLFPYEEARAPIKQWKFNGDNALGFRLGQLLGTSFSEVFSGCTVSYVPRYEEAYPYIGNHLFSLLAGVSYSAQCEIVPAYKKVRKTMPQKSLSKRGRALNLKDSFTSLREVDVVIDDVFTTGTTSKTLYKESPFKAWIVVSRVELDMAVNLGKP
jgi:predicted amidophosphoribosyltransferase